jgi:hypothetical protein
MADNDKNAPPTTDAQSGPPAAPAPAQTVVMESESQRASRALAQAADEAAERKADTMEINPKFKVDGKPMESGGVYIVDGERVDANGRPVKG